jgi:hypothetical protein
MINTLHATRYDLAPSAMPSPRCDEAAWRQRALPVVTVTGGVSVKGTGASIDVRVASDLAFPGHSAWSPPT